MSIRPHPGRRFAFVTVLALVLSACGDVGPVGPPGGDGMPGELQDGRWYLHEANGDALPALISDRIVGVAQEQTFLDSAWIDVVVSEGRWEQRYWYRVEVTGVLDRTEVVLDAGAYTIGSATAYFFSSDYRVRTLVVSPLETPARLVTEEPMLFFTGAPTVAGVYRRTPP